VPITLTTTFGGMLTFCQFSVFWGYESVETLVVPTKSLLPSTPVPPAKVKTPFATPRFGAMSQSAVESAGSNRPSD